MLDIIIPTYKNKEGLRRTLSSIDFSLQPEITVTVIDDCSKMYYNDILEDYSGLQIFYLPKNSGPGNARQYGIEMTNQPYLTFIDTDDTFLNKNVFPTILNTIKENPNDVMFTWQYKIDNKISKETNNRMHGRVYKREFIDRYNISFCPEASFTNEDIGFNRLCRMIIRDKNLPQKVFQDPIINYIKNENSITNFNKGEFFFCQQNTGLSLNTIHTLNIAEKNNLSINIILEELNSIMASLYYTFLCTAYERPKFLQEAWEGARLFYYNAFLKYIEINNSEIIMMYYAPFIKRIYRRAKKWKNFQTLNYTRFLQDLRKYENPPMYYLFDNK